MAQLTFDIPKVDEKATRAQVKRTFEEYHEIKASLETLENANPQRFLLGLYSGPIDGNQTMMYPQSEADMIRGSKVHNTGEDLSKLAERMYAHQEQVKRMQALVQAVERAVESLPHFEREVMMRTLMINKYFRKKDSMIWPEMGLTKNVFYEHKEKAMLRIAFALRIEVYEKPLGTAA